MMRVSKFLVLFPVLALGIYFGSQSELDFRHIILFLCLLGLWLVLAYNNRQAGRYLYWIVLVLGVFLLGMVNMQEQQMWAEPVKGKFTAVAVSVDDLSFYQRVIARLRPGRHLVAVHLPVETVIDVGDQFTFTGSIETPAKAPNPGVFCYQSYLARLGVFGFADVQDYDIISRARQGIMQRVKDKIRTNLITHLQEPGLALALVLGERDSLPSERSENWRLLGLSHLLAISGMHVGLIALVVTLIGHKVPLSPVTKLVCSQLVLLFYIVVAGSAVSAWRAFLFSLFGAILQFRRIKVDYLHLWSLIGWSLLLFKPNLLFDLGFTLSFAASGGILLWGPVCNFRFNSRVLTYICNSLAISLVAQMSVGPLLVSSFGEVSLLGPFATLLFVPLVFLVLVGGIGVAIGFGPFGLGTVLDIVMLGIENLEEVLLPFARVWRPGNLAPFELLLPWVVFIIAGWHLRKPRLVKRKMTQRKLISLVLVTLVFFTLPPVFRRPLEITAVNVGQGDSYYLRTPSGLHLLIDGGGDSPYWQERGRNVGEQRLVPYLKYRGVKRLDYVILSHPHEDHLHGLLAVLEEFPVGMVLDNGHSHASNSYQRYLALIADKEIPYRVVKAGDRLQLGDGITLDVLFPPAVNPDYPSAYNNNSLLLQVRFGGLRMLFTGDLELPILYDLVYGTDLDLRSQWLKVPHHGSRGSLLPEFYERVKPRWAVISVGPNSFGHPHREVTDYLTQNKIKWRTTREGPVTFQAWWGLAGRVLVR